MGEAGGGVEGEEGEETRKGKWQIRRKSEWAAALGSKRYFLSLFSKRFRRGGLAWKGAAKPKKNGISSFGMRNAHLLLPRGSEGVVVSA